MHKAEHTFKEHDQLAAYGERLKCGNIEQLREYSVGICHIRLRPLRQAINKTDSTSLCDMFQISVPLNSTIDVCNFAY